MLSCRFHDAPGGCTGPEATKRALLATSACPGIHLESCGPCSGCRQSRSTALVVASSRSEVLSRRMCQVPGRIQASSSRGRPGAVRQAAQQHHGNRAGLCPPLVSGRVVPGSCTASELWAREPSYAMLCPAQRLTIWDKRKDGRHLRFGFLECFGRGADCTDHRGGMRPSKFTAVSCM